MHRLMIGSCNDSLLFPWAIQDLADDIEQVPLDLDGYFGLAIVMEREIVFLKNEKMKNLLTFMPILNIFLILRVLAPSLEFYC